MTQIDEPGVQTIDDMFNRREMATLEAVADVVKTSVDGMFNRRETAILEAVADLVKTRVKPPNVTVSPAQVTVSPAQVNIPAPKIVVEVDMKPVAEAIVQMGLAIAHLVKEIQRPREKRSMTITHEDGTKSVIEEE